MEVQLHSLTSAQEGVSDQLLASARFTPREGTHDTLLKGGSVGPRAILDNLNEIQILLPMPKIEPRFLGREARSPVTGCMFRPKQARHFSENVLP